MDKRQSLITRPWRVLPTIARLLAVIDSVCQQSHQSQPKSVTNPSISPGTATQTGTFANCLQFLLAYSLSFCVYITYRPKKKMTKRHRSSYEMSTNGQPSLAQPAEEFAIDVHKVNLSYGWRGETVLDGLSLQLPRGNVRVFN